MSNTARTKGHNWERSVMHDLSALYPKIKTSRNESLTEDANCIDLCNTGNLAIQCKNYKTKPNFTEELKKMQTDKIKVLAFKYNKVRGPNGEFAVMKWKDFVKILTDIGEIF